jgi:hypothetical protein
MFCPLGRLLLSLWRLAPLRFFVRIYEISSHDAAQWQICPGPLPRSGQLGRIFARAGLDEFSYLPA